MLGSSGGAGPSESFNSTKLSPAGPSGASKASKRVNLGGSVPLPPVRAGRKSLSAADDAQISARSGIDGLGRFDPDRRASQALGIDFHSDDINHVQELRDDGHSATDLHHLGISASAMRTVGFTARELRAADYTRQQLADAGFSAEAIKLAGFQPITWSFGGVRYQSTFEDDEQEDVLVENDPTSGWTFTAGNPAPARPRRGSRLASDVSVTQASFSRRISDQMLSLDETTGGPSFEEWQQIMRANSRHSARSYQSSVSAGTDKPGGADRHSDREATGDDLKKKLEKGKAKGAPPAGQAEYDA